jgi:hypothetical protein
VPIEPDVRRFARMAPRQRRQGSEPGFVEHNYSNVSKQPLAGKT